jgi:hypothetical protein
MKEYDLKFKFDDEDIKIFDITEFTPMFPF